MNKEFLTVQDIAEMLGLSQRTIRKLFADGVIQGRKVAGKYVTTSELLKKYISDYTE